MAINTFASLQTSMGKWLKRPDLATLFPDFINLAEVNISRVVMTKNRRTSFISTPTTDVIALPADWDKIIHVYYNGKPLPFFPSDFESAYAGGKNGRFTGYQINGDNIVINVLQLGQTLQIDYYKILTPLSDTNQTNVIITDAPDIYLYAALAEAAVYVRDDIRAQMWAAKRDAAIQSYIDNDEDAKTPDQPLYMRKG